MSSDAMQGVEHFEQAIKFEEVSKIYRLGNRHSSLRSALAGLIPGRRRDHSSEELVALNRLSFAIGRGESVGLIGPNGSGKTTTLKLISNITYPSHGEIQSVGRISTLIELGAGFHPDLTGRENIFLNAAILGMSRAEVEERFDAIVDFSGLERFLDTPVKRYSSGMYCRLGFAVAAHVNPDILLIDEVLVVGDRAFQMKCLKRMSELRSEGTTIVFVTHSLGYLQRLCERVIFLYQGNVVADGPASEVIQVYKDHPAYRTGIEGKLEAVGSSQGTSSSQAVAPTDSKVKITTVYFSDGDKVRVDNVSTGSSLTIHIGYAVVADDVPVNVELWVYGLDGTEYVSIATLWDGLGPVNLRDTGEICLHIEPVSLMPGTYYVNVALSDLDGLEKYDVHYERHRIEIVSGPNAFGLVYLPHRWEIVEAETQVSDQVAIEG
jgi:ABC-type polysaccharide/polyol phosphate transport system ATPase subunit